MKTGILALGRRRLERLVILVDVRVFALQVCAIHYDLWFYSFAGPPRCTSLDFQRVFFFCPPSVECNYIPMVDPSLRSHGEVDN